MLGHYTEKGYQIAEMQFDSGVVALDIDAPGKVFADSLHDTMIERVNSLASELSQKWELGRFWIYETGSPGAHVIFENPTVYWEDILSSAAKRIGWKECTAHLALCAKYGFCGLRVGHKPGRNWDIFAWPTNPTENKPKHIIEHESLLELRLEATQK